jgi:peroxin-5
MAWQSLVSGAECSTSANPLGSLLKQSEQDTSLHHDRFDRDIPAGGSSSAFRSQQQRPFAGAAGPSEDAQRFFAANSPAGPSQSDAFAMQQMRRELDSLEAAGSGDPGSFLVNFFVYIYIFTDLCCVCL